MGRSIVEKETKTIQTLHYLDYKLKTLGTKCSSELTVYTLHIHLQLTTDRIATRICELKTWLYTLHINLYVENCISPHMVETGAAEPINIQK
jgi:hypothetical protein